MSVLRQALSIHTCNEVQLEESLFSVPQEREEGVYVFVSFCTTFPRAKNNVRQENKETGGTFVQKAVHQAELKEAKLPQYCNNLLREVNHDRLADRQDHDADARHKPARGHPNQRAAVHDRREREHRARVKAERGVDHRPPAEGIAGRAKGGNEEELDHAYPSRHPLFGMGFTVLERGI